MGDSNGKNKTYSRIRIGVRKACAGAAAAIALFCFTQTSKAIAEYVDIVQIGEQAEIRTTYHAKENIMINARSGSKNQFGLLYGVKENEFLFALGGSYTFCDSERCERDTSHLLQLGYLPKKMRYRFTARHTKEVISFDASYLWSDSFGFVVGFDSKNKITIGLRKWID